MHSDLRDVLLFCPIIQITACILNYKNSSLKAIEKAIVSSDLGMTPNNDGEVIRLSLPQLTTERRKVLLYNVIHSMLLLTAC